MSNSMSNLLELRQPSIKRKKNRKSYDMKNLVNFNLKKKVNALSGIQVPIEQEEEEAAKQAVDDTQSMTSSKRRL